MLSAALVSLSLASAAFAQLAGNVTAEVHPTLSWQECSRNGGCSTKSSASVTPRRQLGDGTVCTNGATCSQKCALEGGNYQQTYGITASGNSLTLKFVTKSEGTNVGSRVYLMEDDNNYKMFKPPEQGLPCGLNGALYFVQMDKDGGKSKYASNKAEANVEGWNPSPNSPNSGKGTYGACCAEMDIWEANSISSAYTPHPCKTTNEGATTDPARQSTPNKKMTVVTQFITDNNSTTGNLVEIRRLYVQDGKENGGLVQMGKSLGKGHVLVLSIWDDYDAQMLWLDSQAYPIDANPSTPGVARGTCATTSGKPSEVEAASPDAQVIFSNIKFGDIGSTFTGTPINPPVGTSQTQWGQCGGTGYSGPTTCASPYTCHKINDFYSQCY
ncbi:cellulase [Coprinopsis sp. MPI-PUGE-AT-0042]|nr:cellulase [Coprinopsis sp. MPI-PUGE-AT-0042]